VASIEHNERELSKRKLEPLTKQLSGPEGEMVELILTVLEADYSRRAEQIKHIREGFEELFRPRLKHYMQQSLEKFPNRKDAIRFMTQHIMAQLDGGDVSIPNFNGKPPEEN
jgi:chromosome segregation and condensation protein ScpB